jgi:predicted ATP-grasp superfamily ATP-dependent carboligase
MCIKVAERKFGGMAPSPRDKESGNVLVMGDDMRIFLAVTRALGRAGKIVHVAPFDNQAPALKSRYVAKIHDLPNYASDKRAWLQAFRTLIKSHNIELVIPCTDPRIIMLHEQRDELQDVKLAIPSSAAMDWLFDKEMTHGLCDQLGVKVAPAARLAASDTAESLIARFNLPMVIKPRRSYWNDQLGSADTVHIVKDHVQLAALLPTLTRPERWLVEGYFQGAGIGISILASEGRIFQAFQHRRLREGFGGSSSYRISEKLHAGMLADARKICTHMKHTGVCMFEFRFNDQIDDWILLETNARFWGSMGLAVHLGLDYPSALRTLMIEGREIPQPDYAAGVRSRNFLLDGLNILREVQASRSIGKFLIDMGDFALQPLRWIAGHETSDGFVLDDAKPGFQELSRVFKRS